MWKEGWKIALSPPIRADKGGLSCGVVVGFRGHIGTGDSLAGPGPPGVGSPVPTILVRASNSPQAAA